MPTVTFLSLDVVETLRNPGNVISIGDPNSRQPDWRNDPDRFLRIEFSPNEDSREKDYVPFNQDMANQVIDFVQGCVGEDVVVHCKMGISRSAAVAKFIADKLDHKMVFDRRGRKDTNAYDREVYERLCFANLRKAGAANANT